MELVANLVVYHALNVVAYQYVHNADQDLIELYHQIHQVYVVVF